MVTNQKEGLREQTILRNQLSICNVHTCGYAYIHTHVHVYTHVQVQTGKQQTYRQTDRHTDRQTYRQTDTLQ